MRVSVSLDIVKRAPGSLHGPTVFSIMRNESYFLPFFFAHYRSMGVDHFVIYDDRSDDASGDFLRAQPDCTIVRSDRRFGDVLGVERNGLPLRLPMWLKRELPERMFPGRWVLTVDADEFLILPPGFADLPQMTHFLDDAQRAYLTAPMVDFHAETLDHRNYPRTRSPFSENPYFDVGPYCAWKGGIQPERLPAGVRHRLLTMLKQKYPDQIPLIFGNKRVIAPRNWKVPLLKHGCGIIRIGDHEVSARPTGGEVTAALAHFKFYPDLDAKIATALTERQYFNGSMEYAFLDAAIRLLGGERLVSEKTRRFAGANSLQEAALIQGAAAN